MMAAFLGHSPAPPPHSSLGARGGGRGGGGKGEGHMKVFESSCEGDGEGVKGEDRGVWGRRGVGGRGAGGRGAGGRERLGLKPHEVQHQRW